MSSPSPLPHLSLTFAQIDHDPADLKKFRSLKRSAQRPNNQLISDLKAWVQRKKNFTIFGAPWQSDAQMMYLLRKFSWINGIIRYCVCVWCVVRVCMTWCVLCVYSEDSDFWTMGARNWHAGYSTRSTQKYRSVIGNKTKVPSLGSMSTPERFAEVVCVSIVLLAHPMFVCVGSGLRCGLETISFQALKVSGGQRRRGSTMSLKVCPMRNPRYVDTLCMLGSLVMAVVVLHSLISCVHVHSTRIC